MVFNQAFCLGSGINIRKPADFVSGHDPNIFPSGLLAAFWRLSNPVYKTWLICTNLGLESSL